MKKILLIIALMFIGIINVNALHDDVDFLSKNITSNNYNRTQARYLQKELNMVMGCDLDTDGIVGPLTKACIIEFQSAYGLETDGLVGPATRTKLNQLYSEDKIIVRSSTVRIHDNPGTNTPILFRAKKGDLLTVLDRVTLSDTVWYYIRTKDGRYGYVTSNPKYTRSTFVEVDIVSQTLRLYENTELVLDTPVTTGKADGRHDTNKGLHYATFKDTDRVLMPSNSFVNYWIRFYEPRSLGVHDATKWRGYNVNFSTYGGTVYKQQNGEAGKPYTGSHGCVNVPGVKMPRIYEAIRADKHNNMKADPIYVH